MKFSLKEFFIFGAAYFELKIFVTNFWTLVLKQVDIHCMFLHVTYAFQSESTLYSSLNVTELLAPSRHKVWSLSDSIWTQTYNHLVHKRIRTFNH